MAFLQQVLDWIHGNQAVSILAFIVALDTSLAQIPAVASNSTFQLVTGWIKSLKKLILGDKEP